MNVRLNKLNNINTEIPQTDLSKKSDFVVLPYVNYGAITIKKIASRFDLNVIFKCCNKLKMFNNLGKDPIPKMYKSCVVYKIDCQDCDMSYTGQSSRIVEKRVQEHISDWKHDRDKSALVMHMRETGHKFNFDYKNIKVLDEEKSYFRRLISEMIFVTKFKCVNRIQDTQNLKSVFKNYVDKLL